MERIIQSVLCCAYNVYRNLQIQILLAEPQEKLRLWVCIRTIIANSFTIHSSTIRALLQNRSRLRHSNKKDLLMTVRKLHYFKLDCRPKNITEINDWLRLVIGKSNSEFRCFQWQKQFLCNYVTTNLNTN